MKIELRNIKVHLGLSDETYAYTGTVYVDGKKAVEVSNQGHGGPDMQGDIGGGRKTVEKLNAWIAANEPPLDMSKYKMADIPADLEHWCHRKVSEFLDLRDMRRALRSSVVFEDGKGALRTLKYNRGRKPDAALREQARDKHGAVRILNELSEAAAFEIWQASAA